MALALAKNGSAGTAIVRAYLKDGQVKQDRKPFPRRRMSGGVVTSLKIM